MGRNNIENKPYYLGDGFPNKPELKTGFEKQQKPVRSIFGSDLVTAMQNIATDFGVAVQVVAKEGEEYTPTGYGPGIKLPVVESGNAFVELRGGSKTDWTAFYKKADEIVAASKAKDQAGN